jgi:hypothetical protein
MDTRRCISEQPMPSAHSQRAHVWNCPTPGAGFVTGLAWIVFLHRSDLCSADTHFLNDAFSLSIAAASYVGATLSVPATMSAYNYTSAHGHSWILQIVCSVYLLCVASRSLPGIDVDRGSRDDMPPPACRTLDKCVTCPLCQVNCNAAGAIDGALLRKAHGHMCANTAHVSPLDSGEA